MSKTDTIVKGTLARRDDDDKLFKATGEHPIGGFLFESPEDGELIFVHTLTSRGDETLFVQACIGHHQRLLREVR